MSDGDSLKLRKKWYIALASCLLLWCDVRTSSSPPRNEGVFLDLKPLHLSVVLNIQGNRYNDQYEYEPIRDKRLLL
jgi:hypothetical protein